MLQAAYSLSMGCAGKNGKVYPESSAGKKSSEKNPELAVLRIGTGLLEILYV